MATAARRCDSAYIWQDLPLASFSNKRKILPLISGGIQFAQVTQAVTLVPKKITRHKSLTKHSFYTPLVLAAFIYFGLPHTGLLVWSQDARQKAYREGSWFAGRQNKKRPLCQGRRHNVLNFPAIWLCYWWFFCLCVCFFQWGHHVILVWSVSFVSKVGAIKLGPNLLYMKSSQRRSRSARQNHCHHSQSSTVSVYFSFIIKYY